MKSIKLVIQLSVLIMFTFATCVMAETQEEMIAAGATGAKADVPDYPPPNPHADLLTRRGWKNRDRFEISNIDGLKESYKEEEPIVFHVKGSSDLMDVEPSNGFYVISGLEDLSKPAGYIASVEYDAGRHAWKVAVHVPKNDGELFELKVAIVCGGIGTPCIGSYGLEAMAEKNSRYRCNVL